MIFDIDCVIGNTATILRKNGVSDANILLDLIFGKHFKFYYYKDLGKIEAYGDKMKEIEKHGIKYNPIAFNDIGDFLPYLDFNIPLLCISDYYYLDYIQEAKKEHKLHAFTIYNYDALGKRVYICDCNPCVNAIISFNKLRTSIHSKHVNSKCFSIEHKESFLRDSVLKDWRKNLENCVSNMKCNFEDSNSSLFCGIEGIREYFDDLIKSKRNGNIIDCFDLYFMFHTRERHKRYLKYLREAFGIFEDTIIDDLAQNNKNWQIIGNLCLDTERKSRFFDRILKRVSLLIEGELNHANRLSSLL